MFVVLDEETERSLFEMARARPPFPASGPLSLNAFLNVDEDLIVAGIPVRRVAGKVVAVRCYALPVLGDSAPAYPAGLSGRGGPRLVLLGVTGGSPPELRAFYYSSRAAPPQACQLEVVRLETDVFSRIKGIFDTRVLAAKTVCVIGVGSGGSTGALEMAKSGVGNFILVDFDRLRAHNVSRHVCGLADVGRYKTRAVRDAILQHNPQASVECHEADIAGDSGLLGRVVARSDLVLVATDTELSRYLVNEACLAADTPALYGGAYDRAFAGEVVRVIPGAGGCYACVRQRLANTMRSLSSQQVFDYTEDSELQAEPGLGLDVSFIAMIQAKWALMTLLRDTNTGLGDIDAEMIIWTNSARPQDGELFERPLVRHLVRVPRSEECPSCGSLPGGEAEEEGFRP